MCGDGKHDQKRPSDKKDSKKQAPKTQGRQTASVS